MDEVCSNCRFWKPDVIAHGFCKRHAPAMKSTLREVPNSPFNWYLLVSDTQFPETAPDDWCGEFKLKGESDGRD